MERKPEDSSATPYALAGKRVWVAGHRGLVGGLKGDVHFPIRSVGVTRGQIGDPEIRLGWLAKTRHVVIVDGDPAMRETVARYFEEHSIPVSAVSNRAGLSRHLAVMNPCLILLEARLGQDDGLDVLREIRAHSDFPIIMTGHRLDETDRVVGLEIGADDCIVKPFGLRELLARVRAVFRRQEMGRVARTRDPERGGYRFGGWQLERRGRKLKRIPVILKRSLRERNNLRIRLGLVVG